MRALMALVLGLALAGCVTTRGADGALPPAQVAAAEARQAEREAQLRAQDAWSFAGRIAVATAGQGGSGRIDWRQAGPGFEVALSAPVTRQSWRLSVQPTGATLEGLEGGTRSGPAAGPLLREATGWDIPVDALNDWVRGLRAAGPASVTYGIDSRPRRIAQAGWTIDYTWPADPAATLPARLEARRETARVRLVIDTWGDGDG
ncbi:MAG: lipoprotein insertase outer membrane protein LolB [Pseudomonas sp.]|nr:lipoprotein insertase outer membrane protein LolB [Pseudomonas sp.]